MKILHITPSYKPAYIYGGPIESVSRLCETLQQNGHTIRVLTTTANGKEELPVTPGKEVLVEGVPVIYFARWTKGNTHSSPALWRYLYRHVHEYDVVHVHSWWNVLVIVATMICHARGAKVVLSPRGMLSDYILHNSHGFAKKWIHRLVGKKALQKTIFHATAEPERTECLHLIPDWQGVVLPNLLQLPDFPPVRDTNEVFTLVFLSRIHPKKGIELIFQALSQLSVPIRLIMAGSGDVAYVDSLKNLSAELQIADAVTWIGWVNRNEKFKMLAKADAFILTSHNENFANTVVESLAVGTPVIITENVGLATYVLDNDLGWVIEYDSDILCKTIEDCIKNTKKRISIHSSYESVRRDFDSRYLIMKYIDCYSSLFSNAILIP